MSDFPYDHFRSENALAAGRIMWQVFAPILLICGTVGNVLSILILSKQKFRKWSSSVFLIGLAGADLSVLYIGLTRQWLRYQFDVEIRNLSPVICKVHWWLMYCAADMSVWSLTSITLERLVSTVCASKSKTLCTTKRARMVLLFIVLCVLAMNSHLLFGFGRLEVRLDANTTMVIPCAPLNEEYGQFFGKIWTWIDLCKYSIIPFIILTIGNISIIWKVTKTERKAKRQVMPAAAAAPATNKKTSSMSKLLFSLNIVFIVCTSPVCIYFIGEPYWIPSDIPRNIKLEDPWWAIVNFFMYVNSTVNFVLYCVSGSRFREELKKIIFGNSVRSFNHNVSSTGIRTSMRF